MIYNNAVQIKRDVLFRTARAFMSNDDDELNRIPLNVAPRDNANIRCCVHKDRAVIKYRVMAALGFAIEDETDEIKMLSEYKNDIKFEKEIDKRSLTVIHDACKSCKLGHHYISDVCQGCVARPCTTICPKNAVTMINGRSVIDTSLCINCGKCTHVCPYNAIIKVPVPCETACPVDALRKNSNNVAEIDFDKCISCGRCMKSCPFGAITDRSQMTKVLNAIKSGAKVNALLAPSVVGQFPGDLEQIKSAVGALGFNQVIDVADGAVIVVKEESAEFLEKNDIMTTSCCPSYIECIDKHLQNMKPNVSHTPSPMMVSGKMSKNDNPEVVNVFIGPCLAKKLEAYKNELIDFVLTFEELGAMLMAGNVEVLSFPAKEDLVVDKVGFNFAASGGVLGGVALRLKDQGFDVKGDKINGLDKQTIKKLKVFHKMPQNFDFLEVMACEGGCINGPGVIVQEKISKKRLESL